MDDLTRDVVHLTKTNRDGSFTTQKNRQRGLVAISKNLKELGYKIPSATHIKPKHIEALVQHWQEHDCTPATIRNRLSWLRWWAGKINKAPVVERENKAYGINRKSTGKLNRAQTFDTDKFNQIECSYVKGSLLLQSAFGLRREEAIKFNPKYAIRHGFIRLKASWTKGGRYREIPITSIKQQKALHAVQQMTKRGALIPSHLNYKQQMKRYEYQTHKAGWYNTHGLRHAYAQNRYQEITKLKCPLQGGPTYKMMSPSQREMVHLARLQISKELGHQRVSITTTYLGRFA